MKPFTPVAVLVFALVALAHVLRLIYGWDASIGGASVPMGASVLAAIVAGALAAGLWWESRK